MSTKIQVTVTKRACLDDFQNGCEIPTTDHGIIDTFKVDTCLEALEEIEKQYGTPIIYSNRLEFSRNENGDGEEPKDYQLTEWKLGNRKLYLADYSFYLEEIRTLTLTHSKLADLFPHLEREEGP